MSEQRITPQALIGLRLPADLAVAPDGASVLFTVSDLDFTHGDHEVQLHRVPGPVPDSPPTEGPLRTTTQLTRGIAQIEAPAWSPDGRQLAFITFRPQPHEDEEDDQREGGDDKRQVFVMAAEGGEARRLTELAEGVEAFRWAADGTGVFVVGLEPRPAAERGWRRRRQEAREDAIVVQGDPPTVEFWFQPLDGDPRRLFGGIRGFDDFDVSPDGGWIAYASNGTGWPQHSDRYTVRLRRIADGAELPASGGRGGAESEPRFGGDGRFLYFRGWNDPALLFSRQEVYAVALPPLPAAPEEPDDAEPRAGARSATTGAGSGPASDLPSLPAPQPLFATLDRDVEEYTVLADGRVAAALAWGMESRIALADPCGGAPRLLEGPRGVVGELAAARSASRLAAVVETPSSAPEVVWVDLGSGAAESLSDLNPGVRSWRRAERRRLAWRNEGFDHEGLLLLPARADRVLGERPPLFVALHGGPHWRVQDTLRTAEAEVMAAEGWAVFLPQYRGSSGAGEAYQLAIRGDLGGADARDVLTGIDAVVAAGEVDGGRVAVGGGSYGGYLASWLLATTTRFKAGVSIAGIGDLAQDFATSEHALWELHYLGGAPWERPDLYRERSPLSRLETLTAPLLLLHGLDDETTFVGNGKGLFQALRMLGRTSEFVVYPREGHGSSEPAHRLDEIERTLDWIGRHVCGLPPRLVGGRVERDGRRLQLFGHQVREDYAGVRPRENWSFLEVSGQLLAAEAEAAEPLVIVPCGPASDLLLVDAENGDRFRPLGIPVEIHGRPQLLLGEGVFEAHPDEDGRAPVLAFACTFEVPEGRRRYRLHLKDLPPLLLVAGEPPEG